MKKILSKLALGVLAVMVLFPAVPVSAAYPGENGKILFRTYEMSGFGEVNTINPDGSGRTQLNFDDAGASLKYSPTGQFMLQALGGGLVLHDAEGLEESASLPLPDIGDCGASSPTWAPDELTIAYVATCNGDAQSNADYYIVKLGLASGVAEVFEFGNLPHHVGELSWAPKGGYLLFTYGYPDTEEDVEIYRLKTDGSEVLQLTDNEANDFSPDWSPDGQSITFVSDGDGDMEIYSMSLEGDGVLKLTNNTSDEGMPYYSPDGLKIVYKSAIGSDGSMFTMDANGANKLEILDMPSGNAPTVDGWQSVNVTPFVYRFWSDTKKHHFYTAEYSEALEVISTYPDTVWRYEGVAFQASSSDNCSGRKPVFRFWSDKNQGHFYTISATEKQQVISQYDDSVWRYEGVAYCADESDGPDTKPLFRFWSNTLNGHFYTTSVQEKQQVIDAYSDDVWRYEGVAAYVE